MQNQIYRVLIIDDESGSRHTLRHLIERFCPQLLVVAEAVSVEDALLSIQKHQPAIIFLDIDLTDGSGFDILDAFPKPDFKIIFTTAHEEFALKAFKYRALHYLIKPIDPEDLVSVTQELQPPASFWPAYEMLQQSLKNIHRNKLFLSTVHGTAVIRSDEVSYIFADERYATVVMETGEKIFVSESLSDLEGRLPGSEFVRPHQSYIVQINAVRRVQRGDGLTLVLRDKTEIPVSRRRKEEVLRLFSFGTGPFN